MTPADRFGGRVAIVTGAAGGIGWAAVERLSSDGARVVAVDLDVTPIRDAVAGLRNPAVAVAADVSDPAGVDGYMAAAVEAFGSVDLHFLNAGIAGTPAVPVAETSDIEWDRVMAVNVRGPYLGVRAAFRRYAAQGSDHGSIVVTASIAALRGAADLLAYTTSKHAVRGLVHGAAVSGGPLGIRVNAVAPGIVPTAIFGEAGMADMVRRATTAPLRRAGRATEVAAAVAFLLSDDASYITGDTLSVDGGASVQNTNRHSGGAGLWDPSELDAALRP